MNTALDDAELSVFAYGKLVWDHVFSLDAAQRVRFIGSSGGGSAFNTLVNVARHENVRAHAVGVAGDDRPGRAAAQQLRDLGASTTLVRLQPGTRTSLIFEILEGHDLRLTGQSVVKRMGTTCAVCGLRARVDADPKLTETDRNALVAGVADTTGRGGVAIACFDHLTRDRVGAAREARRAGAVTALDLGRLGFLRYVPATEVVSQLAAFDVVMIAQGVADSLVERAGLQDFASLARNGPARLLVVSDGAAGLSAFACGGHQVERWHVPAPAGSDVLDDTGAGDAVLAHVLWEIGTACARRRPVGLREATERAAESVREVLRSWGARGHLGVAFDMRPGEVTGLSHDAVGNRDTCTWCGAVLGKRSPSAAPSARPDTRLRLPAVAARNGSYLLLRRALFAAEQRQAARLCADVLAGTGTAVVVGSGGSYSAAVYVAQVLRRHSSVFATVMHPREYALSRQTTNHVVVFSYSGRTHDCGRAIQRAKELGSGQIHLLTAAREPRLGPLLRAGDALITYGRRVSGGEQPGRERGFVSMAGTVAPSALWAAAASDASEFTAFMGRLRAGYDDLIRRMQEVALRLASCLNMRRPLHVFHGTHGAAAAVDLESKFTEGNLGAVVLHEAKDFSHGRFMAVLDTEPRAVTLALQTGAMSRYEVALADVLARTTDMSTISVGQDGILGGLELLFAIQVLARECGRLAGKDISRPVNIPKDGLKLYRWGSVLD